MAREKVKEVAIQLQEMHSEHLLEHGIDLQRRTIQLIGDIDEESFAFIDAALTTLENLNKKPVVIKICSYGGSTHHALAIVSRIRTSVCKITTEGYGAIMSASTLILAAGHLRRFAEDGVFMHHEAAYILEGTHTQNKHAVKQYEREEKMWAKIMAKYTGKPMEFWLESGKNGIDFHLDAAQCLEHGICDEVF